MDSRWRFLHCDVTELWGHVREVGAGNGESGRSGVPAREENPPDRWEAVTGTEIKVGKLVSHASRKAAIVRPVPVP